MKTRNLIGIVGASLIVAACGGGGGGGGAVGPTSVSVPAWVSVGIPEPALSANIAAGTSSTDVTITFNADGSLTFNVGGDVFSVTNAEIAASSAQPIGEIFFYRANTAANGGVPDFVELFVLDDAASQDIIALARFDRFNTPLGYETSAVIGDTTISTNLPGGNANYSGFMIGSLLFNGSLPDFDSDGIPDLEYDFVGAEADIGVNFVSGDVTVAFTNFVAGDSSGGLIPLGNSALNGTASIATGTSQYTGTISGMVENEAMTEFDLNGALIGGFFGGNGEATAGAFDLNETGGGNAEFVGNFAAAR